MSEQLSHDSSSDSSQASSSASTAPLTSEATASATTSSESSAASVASSEASSSSATPAMDTATAASSTSAVTSATDAAAASATSASSSETSTSSDDSSTSVSGSASDASSSDNSRALDSAEDQPNQTKSVEKADQTSNESTEQDPADVARQSKRKKRHRRLTVLLSVIVTIAIFTVYIVADVYDVVPGYLTLHGETTQRMTQEALTSKSAANVIKNADLTKQVDSTKAQKLIEELTKTDGVGSYVSVALMQADGTLIAASAADTAREPASTLKTVTALAAASVLDMGATLKTQAYMIQDSTNGATIVLKGGGDMLLGAGESDPDHINGRAGIATLAADVATALKQRGISTIHLVYDDSLFGSNRYPSRVKEVDDYDLYYTGVSSMAIDGGRLWQGSAPSNPDVFEAYPTLSQTTAADTAQTFANRLKSDGITINGSIAQGSAPTDVTPIAQVESAPLSAVMMFMLQHSDNTLAEEFGRLLAIAKNDDNSPTGAVKAVQDEIKSLGINTDHLVMSDCSGLSPGSKITAQALAEVQVKNFEVGTAAAAAEGLSIPGLVGTAKSRLASNDAAGLMRVKTGTLEEVTSMVGNVSRTNGGVLAFAVLVNKPKDFEAAKTAINKFIANLVSL